MYTCIHLSKKCTRFFLLPEANLELFVAGPINTQMDDFVKYALSNFVGLVVLNKSH